MTMPSLDMPPVDAQRATVRAWAICGLLLLATMLMYMDRQALAQQKREILLALELTNADYGWLELGFGLAFAVGGICSGLLADRFGPRWLYPTVLVGWSSVGFATGWVTNYNELLVCRVLLGFFEAGHWPCALMAAQRLLTSRDRPLGNSILQSGASLGAIATPIVVLLLASQGAEGWRLPFRVIGASGAIWVFAWLAVIRPGDLSIGKTTPASGIDPGSLDNPLPTEEPADDRVTLIRRFVALMVVVVTINLCWQYFRAWMPGMLGDQYGYSKQTVQSFSIAYYVATDVGCLSIGFLVKWLASRGVMIHRARMMAFFGCCVLTLLSMVAALLPASPLLLVVLLVIGFGSLGQFPVYYALTQELSTRRMGRVSGVLSFVTWTSTALVQPSIGAYIDRTHAYTATTLIAGCLPMVGLLALILLWGPSTKASSS